MNYSYLGHLAEVGSKSADSECLRVLCASGIRLAPIVVERRCGSCLAAEQFIDIKLGAKYFLTLTSIDKIIEENNYAARR